MSMTADEMDRHMEADLKHDNKWLSYRSSRWHSFLRRAGNKDREFFRIIPRHCSRSNQDYLYIYANMRKD